MRHLLTILHIKITEQGKVIWEEKNIKNVIHKDAEYFLLSASFDTSSGITIPTNYYAGLDNRTTLSTDDNLSSLQNEPTTHGYSRVAVSSYNGFTVELNDDDIYQATSLVLTYTASGGSFGPVRNLFLATTSDSSGYLLASGALSTVQTLSDGQSMSAKIGISLKDC